MLATLGGERTDDADADDDDDCNDNLFNIQMQTFPRSPF